MKLTPKKTFVQHWQENGLQKHFQAAKDLLVMATHLVHPDPSCPISLTTDASDTAIGAALEQFKDGSWQPLGFWSKNLPSDKRKWTVYRRELFAIQQGLRHFLPEIDGRHVIVYTDHLPIVGTFKSTAPQPHAPIARHHIVEIGYWTHDVHQ